MNRPTRFSPLSELNKQTASKVEIDGWQVVDLFTTSEQELEAALTGVGMVDRSANGKLRIEGETVAELFGAEDVAINQSIPYPDGRLFRLRSDLFFLRVNPGGETAAAASLAANLGELDRLVTISDVTDGLAEIQLIGPRVRDLQSRLCGLDFDSMAFPNFCAMQTSMAKTSQLIIRQDVGQLPAFSLIGPRSLALYLWQTLLEAGRGLGMAPIGLKTAAALAA